MRLGQETLEKVELNYYCASTLMPLERSAMIYPTDARGLNAI
jgi:hypothetical protein